MEYIENILTAVGGLTVVLVGTLALLRKFAETYINSLINKSANNELERVKNNLAKSMSAYELLLNKEFEFYQKIDAMFAAMIVDIQDLKWNMIGASSVDKSQRNRNTREIMLRILKLIPELKNYCHTYQCYIPLEVNKSVGHVVISLQDNMDQISKTVHLFYNEKDIEQGVVSDYEEKVLISIAMANTMIKTRLNHLAS